MIRHFTINRLTAIVARSILLTMLCGMLFLCNIRGLQAQGLNFPVRADVSIAQPFSPYLEDYTLPQFDRFVLTLNLMDWYNQDQVDVYLQLRLKRINPKPETIRIPADGDVLSQPADKVFQINKGFPSILNGSQLTHLFNYTLDNEGLKEGTYVFQVVVFEAGTGRQLSSVNFDGQIINITRNEPPFLNLPMNGTTVNSEIYPPSPILFQWTPRHILFDPNAGAVNYVLEIWGFPENDLKKDPNNYVQTAAPIFQTLVTGGQTTFLLDYTTFPMDNVFWEAKRYAWRVTAVDETVVSGDLLDPQTDPQTFWSVDAGQNHYFSNLGRSEVFSYYYAHPCNQPDLLHIHTDNPQEIEVQVIRESNHTSFDFLYREFESDVAFSTIHTTESILTLNELRPATTYELSVKAYCDKITAPIRDLGNVTTLDEYLDACEEPAYMTMTEEQIVDAADESITYQQFNFEWEDQHIELSWNVTLTLVDDGGDATQQLTGPFLVSGNTLSISAAPGGLLEGIDMSPFEHITILIERTCADDTEIDETYTFALDGSNSVQGDCKAPDPVYMTVEDVDDPTLEMEDPKRLTWTANSSHHHFDFNYRDRHNSQPDEWTTHPNLTENSLILDKLAYNLQYAYTITYYCNAAGTDFATSTENSFFIKNKDDFTDNVDEGTGSCFAPASTLVEFISTTSVKIYWDKAKKNVGYQFMYRKVGASGWEIINQFERDIELTGLEEDTEYEYQVRTECEDGWSLYTDKETFTTPITTPSRTNSTPCEKVTDLQLADPGAGKTYLNLKFSEKSNYTGYYVEYKSEDQGVNDWYKDVQTPPFDFDDDDNFRYYSLENLYEGTQYDVRITVACGSDEETSKIYKFSTIDGVPIIADFSCGDVDPDCLFPNNNSDNADDGELEVNAIFTMGGFELQVVPKASVTYDDVSDDSFKQNPDGSYNGFAHVVVPYMNNAQVEVYLENVVVKQTTDDKLCAVSGTGNIKGSILRIIDADLANQIHTILNTIGDVISTAEEATELAVETIDALEELMTLIGDPVNTDAYSDLDPIDKFIAATDLFESGTGDFIDEVKALNFGELSDPMQEIKLAAALIIEAYEEIKDELESLDATADIQVVFAPYNNDVGFDAYTGTFPAYYQQLGYADQSSNFYFVPYIAIDPEADIHNAGSGFKKVVATVTMTENYDPAKVSFVTNSVVGQAIQSNNLDALESTVNANNDKEFEVIVPHDAKRVYAIYTDNGKNLKLGKLKVISTPNDEYVIKLIPTFEGFSLSQSTIDDIKADLNEFYEIPNKQFATIEVETAFTESDWDKDENGDLLVDDHLLMSRYSEEMLDLYNDYFRATGEKEDNKTAYFFVMENMIEAGTNEEIAGFFPRNKRVGFLNDNSINSRTIAHEVGHGLFRLSHTWVIDETITEENEPTNLMSYGGGTNQNGGQWNQIIDPVFDLYGLDPLDESQSVRIRDISALSKYAVDLKGDSWLTFLSPAAVPISIKMEGLTDLWFSSPYDDFFDEKVPVGALLHFKQDGIKYKAQRLVENKGYFTRYAHKEDGVVTTGYEEDFSTKKLYKHLLAGLPCIKEGKVVFTVNSTSYLYVNDIPVQNKAAGDKAGELALSYWLTDEYVEIYGDFLTHENQLLKAKFLLNYADLDPCGVEAFYAFQVAEELENNPSFNVCIEELESSVVDQIISDHMPALNYVSEMTPAGSLFVPDHSSKIALDPSIFLQAFDKTVEELKNNREFMKQYYESIRKFIDAIGEKTEQIEQKSTNEIAEILSFVHLQSENIKKCFYQKIPYDIKIKILNHAVDNSDIADLSKIEAIINDILLNVNPDNYADLYNKLKGVNDSYDLFWKLNNVVDDEDKEYDKFIAIITGLIFDIQNVEEITEFIHPVITNADAPVTTPDFFWVYKSETFSYNLTGTTHTRSVDSYYDDEIPQIKILSKSTDSYHSTDINGRPVQNINSYDLSITHDPFTIIQIRFNDNFQIQGPDGTRVNYHNKYRVPLIWVRWLLERQGDIEDAIAFKVGLNALALTLSALTAEPGPALVAEAVLSTLDIVDIVVTLKSDDIRSNGTQDEIDMLNEYEKIANTIQVLSLSRTAYTGLKALPLSTGSILDKLHSIKNSASDIFDLSKGLVDVFNQTIKAFPGNNWPGYAVWKSFMDQAYAQVEIYKHLRGVTNAKFRVDQSKFIVDFLTGGGTRLYSNSLGDVIGDINSGSFALKNPRLFDPDTHVDTDGQELLAEINQVQVEIDGALVTKTYNVYKNGRGYIYLIEGSGDVNSWLDAITARLDGLGSNISTFKNTLNGISDVTSEAKNTFLSLVHGIDDVNDLKRFVDDFASNANALRKFSNGEISVDSWKGIGDAAKRANPDIADAGKILRKDIKSLEAFAKFDADLISKVGQQRFDDFMTSLIKANPKCKTCGNAGSSLVGDLDDVLNDFHKVVTERAVKADGSLVDGFDDFLKEAGEQASKAKGAALTLKKMSKNWDELTQGGWSLNRFEGSIPDIETGHKLDALFKRTNPTTGATEFKSVEMKNWSSARSVSGSTYDQFKAYVTSGNGFEYYFSDGLSDAMKGNFQNVFKDASKATELFNANPSFFTSQNIASPTILNNLANQGQLLNHPTFMNFVR